MMNRLQPLQTQQHQKSNSTSSVYATGTITEPNMGELVSSVSTMLHCFDETARVLTSHGFKSLSELEGFAAAGVAVMYAAYDTAKKQLVYVTGQLVLPANAK